jgi:hypothetical protein
MSRSVDRTWHLRTVIWHRGPDFIPVRAGGDGVSFPEDSWVEVRYPLTREQERGDRAAWPWLPG